jgi:hypothetical protein
MKKTYNTYISAMFLFDFYVCSSIVMCVTFSYSSKKSAGYSAKNTMQLLVTK